MSKTAFEHGKEYADKHKGHPTIIKLIEERGEDAAYKLLGNKFSEKFNKKLALADDLARTGTDEVAQVQPEQKPLNDPRTQAPLMDVPFPMDPNGSGVPDLGATMGNFIPSAYNELIQTAVDWTFNIDNTLKDMWAAAKGVKELGQGISQKMVRAEGSAKDRAASRLTNAQGVGGGVFGFGDDLIAKRQAEMEAASGIPPAPGPQEPVADAAMQAIGNIEGADIGKAIQERPAMLASMLTSPRALAKGLGANKLAAGMGAANPMRTPGQAGQYAMEAIKSRTPEVIGNVPFMAPSALSGVAPQAFRRAWTAGKEQDTPAMKFRELMKGGEGNAKQALDMMLGHMSTLYEKRAMKWETQLAQLQPKVPLEHVLHDLRAHVRDALPKEKGWRVVDTEDLHPNATAVPNDPGAPLIKPVTSGKVSNKITLDPDQPHQALTAGDMTAINKAVEMVENWDWVSPQGLNKLQQNLWNLAPSGESDHAQNIIKGIRNKLRTELGENVYGYNELMTDYSEASELIKQLRYTFSLPVGHKEWKRSYETTLNKLLDLASSSDGYKQELVKQMEGVVGEAFIPQVAGLALSDFMPSGLIGRSQAWNSAKGAMQAMSTSGVAGAALYTANPTFLLGLAFASPRMGGSIVYGMGKAYGWPKRKAKAIGDKYEAILQKIEKNHPSEARAGRAVGDIINSLDRGDAYTYMAMIKELGPEENLLPTQDTASSRLMGNQ
mgnify:CR=1 FL=1|tara:strand:+ start:1394 stop:3559 length:2166 start_codon:yes stop_codon:yes gene_type:complete